MELEIRNLSKRYGKKTAVRGVELSITPGVWGLIGANGAGKTTLMRMIAGILPPSSGRVLYDGVDIRDPVSYTHLAQGDALICFDKDAFCSYGLKQAANAPVSEEAFAGVKAALDELLKGAPVLAGMKFVQLCA